MSEASNKTGFVIGVDLGGTKIFAGVFNPALECVATTKVRRSLFLAFPRGFIAPPPSQPPLSAAPREDHGPA